MNTIAIITTLFVSIIHFYFMYLEMVLWTTKKGIKTFGLKNQSFAEETKVLAANQGLYNGFLAAGLIWSAFNNYFVFSIFILICIIIAGIYGAYSTKKVRIFYIQSIPALVAFLTILFIL